MLERTLAFGVVVALLCGAATLLRDDAPTPGDACLDDASCAAPAPPETQGPACPEGRCPPPPPQSKAAAFRPSSGDGEDDDREEKEDKEAKRGRGDRKDRRGDD